MNVRAMLATAIRQNEARQAKLIEEARKLYELRAAMGAPKVRRGRRRKLRRVKK